jgi:hypothetical protein
MKRFLLSILLLPLVLSAQVQMNGAGSYTQDFNTLANTGSVNPWVNNSTIANWFSQRTTPGTNYNIGTGSLTTGDMYSFGASGATDRALGCIGSDNTQTGGNFAHGVLFQNTGTSTIGNFDISFAMEQWRNGGSNAVQSVSVWYKVSSSMISSLTPNVNTGWTQVPALTSSSSQTSATAGALDGNASANRAVITGLIPATVQAGSYVMIKWEDPNHAGNDDGFGLDDFSVSWNTCTPTLGTDVLTACDSLTWIDGNTYNFSNTGITHNLVNSAGCDSIVSLDLTINYSSNGMELIEACAFPYTDPNSGITYNVPDTIVDVSVGSNGCPVTFTTYVNLIPNPFSTFINSSPDDVLIWAADTTLMYGYQWYDCTTDQNISGATSYSYYPAADGSYALIGQWPNNCVDTSDCFTVIGVGLNEIINKAFTIYPNPSNGTFELLLPSVSATMNIELFNLNGQKICSKEIVGSSKTIELPQISRGTYLLNARTEEESYTTRIIIE